MQRDAEPPSPPQIVEATPAATATPTVPLRSRPALGFPNELRLKEGSRIREILDGGQRAAGERVLLVTLPNELGHARLACVVGRRFDKRAVVRNRWRRRIKEIFRLRRQELEAAGPGWDWVAVALKREGTLAFPRLAKDFLATATRARRAPKGPSRRSGPR